MTVTIDPELENALSRKAAEQGQDADQYLRQLIQSALGQSIPTIIRSTLTQEETQRLRLESTERAVARDLPASLSDFRREDIYDDEEGR